MNRMLLGDKRLESRAKKLVDSIANAPGKSLPQECADDAELQATYRLFGNGRMSMAALLASHIARTVERISAHLRSRTCYNHPSSKCTLLEMIQLFANAF